VAISLAKSDSTEEEQKEEEQANRSTFSCSQCGHCCNTWRVPVDNDRATKLLSIPWVSERLASLQLDFEPLTDWGFYLPLKKDNTCAFWDDDLYCLIHHHEGAEAKPLDCQRFPFAQLPNNDEAAPTRFDVSAACSRVAERYLFLWDAPVLPDTLESTSNASTSLPSPFYPDDLERKQMYARYPWPFHGVKTIPRSGYQDWLKASVLPLFQHGDMNAWQAVNQVQADIHGGTPLPPFGHPLPKGRGDKSVSDWLEHQTLSLWLRTEYGNFPRWQWRFMNRYQDPRLFGNNVIHKKALEHIEVNEDLLDHYARPFVYHLLQRESPLLYGSSLWIHVISAKIAYILLRFYSKAFALHDESPCVEREHIQLAIRCIERYYTAHQPRFLARLEANPHLTLGLMIPTV